MAYDLDQQSVLSESATAAPQSDLVDPVRQLLSSVTAALQNSSAQCSLEEALAQLETTDENFHRLAICLFIVDEPFLSLIRTGGQRI